MTLWVTAMGVEDGHTITTKVNDGGSCTWGAALDCRVSAPLFTATVIDVAVFATYFVLYTYYLWRAWRQLSRELYQKYRMMNTILRLQVPSPPLPPPNLHCCCPASCRPRLLRPLTPTVP